MCQALRVLARLELCRLCLYSVPKVPSRSAGLPRCRLSMRSMAEMAWDAGQGSSKGPRRAKAEAKVGTCMVWSLPTFPFASANVSMPWSLRRVLVSGWSTRVCGLHHTHARLCAFADELVAALRLLELPPFSALFLSARSASPFHLTFPASFTLLPSVSTSCSTDKTPNVLSSIGLRSLVFQAPTPTISRLGRFVICPFQTSPYLFW
ncbi:hypothetical protein F5Y18DRAFT_51893 [Xylariaceae sp. FL1019]|nr:hypothetical protein F5Y18DRAFT_51893 [Xylariaceae sp. FL1019]